MMRGVFAAVGVVLMVVACSGPKPEGVDEGLVEVPVEEDLGPVVADPVEWGVPVTVEGVGGGLEVVPEGVRYVTSEEISSPTEHDHPSRRVFAVVRFTVAAADSVAMPYGWGWRQGGQEYGPGDGGNAVTAPWVGTVPAVDTETAIMGGEDPTVGYVTFDLPDVGGELTYTDEGGVTVRWTAPEEEQGQMPDLGEWVSDQ